MRFREFSKQAIVRLYRLFFYASLILIFPIAFFSLLFIQPGSGQVLPHHISTGSNNTDKHFADSALSLVPFAPNSDIDNVTLDVTGHPELIIRRNSHTKQPIASITKVVLALMLIEEYNLSETNAGPNITYDAEDVDFFRHAVRDGDSNAPVYAGLTLTLRQSLVPLMLPSANNYAISLARHLYVNYPEKARQWLDKKGLRDTEIYDSSGLDDRNVSTGSDLVMLARLAYSDPVLRQIMQLKEAIMPGIGVVKNTNKALGVNGVDGVKTGSGPVAKSNLLFTAALETKRGIVRVYGALIGQKSYALLYARLDSLLKSLRAALDR